jgi:hypothetical protein
VIIFRGPRETLIQLCSSFGTSHLAALVSDIAIYSFYQPRHFNAMFPCSNLHRHLTWEKALTFTVKPLEMPA